MTAADNQAPDLYLSPVGRADERLAVTTNTVVMGRAQDCDLCVADASVSRRHASLTFRNGNWFVADLGSRHGTFLNGVRLDPGQPAPAVLGDLVRIGPFTYRLDGELTGSRTIASTDLTVAPGATIERVSSHRLDRLAHRRLELLIDGAAEMHQATDESALYDAILELALAGTGFRRAAVLRATGSAEQMEVVASVDPQRTGGGGFTFSSTLLAEAAEGEPAMLCRDAVPPPGQSIERLGIHGALCAPIMLDGSVIAYVYLDVRETEPPVSRDAVGFCHAVARLAGLALANLKRAELLRRNHRLHQDLRAAREAQAFMLPQESGTVGHLEYAVRSHPGRLVAGDLFDVIELDGGRVAVYCGDVSGQGAAAAILMVAALSHLRASLLHGADPAQSTEALNRYLCSRSAAHMFLTLWVGVFDGAAATLTYVDAGHGHWFVRTREGQIEAGADRTDMLVGVQPDYAYTARTIDLRPDDRVIVFSDGVVEHRNPEGEFFGRDRVIEVITKCDSPGADVSTTLEHLDRFLGGLELSDDTTMASVAVRAGS